MLSILWEEEEEEEEEDLQIVLDWGDLRKWVFFPEDDIEREEI